MGGLVYSDAWGVLIYSVVGIWLPIVIGGFGGFWVGVAGWLLCVWVWFYVFGCPVEISFGWWGIVSFGAGCLVYCWWGACG